MNKFGLIFFVCNLAAGTAQAACPAGLAVYSHMEDGQFSAAFSKMAQPKAWSDLQFSINTPTTHHDYEFTESNGYAVQYMVPLPEEREGTTRDISVTFFDGKMRALGLPQSDTAAPAYIFAPQVGSVIYYGYEPREFMPVGMFKLSGCAE
jgi:hypothetical protein